MSSAEQSSRNAILSRLRTALPQSTPLPDLSLSGQWQTFPDPVARFREVLELVGGQVICCQDLHAAHEHLQTMAAWQAAAVRCSVVDGVGDSTLELSGIEDPHELEKVDFAVLSGHFGVAENAAIWVTDDTLRHRVLYFLAQHLAIVIPAIVLHNMHEAYAHVTVGQHAFAGFISGPSKTADIEQSLVIGAHGARSLTVYIVEEQQDLTRQRL